MKFTQVQTGKKLSRKILWNKWTLTQVESTTWSFSPRTISCQQTLSSYGTTTTTERSSLCSSRKNVQSRSNTQRLSRSKLRSFKQRSKRRNKVWWNWRLLSCKKWKQSLCSFMSVPIRLDHAQLVQWSQFKRLLAKTALICLTGSTSSPPRTHTMTKKKILRWWTDTNQSSF